MNPPHWPLTIAIEQAQKAINIANEIAKQRPVFAMPMRCERCGATEQKSGHKCNYCGEVNFYVSGKSEIA